PVREVDGLAPCLRIEPGVVPHLAVVDFQRLVLVELEVVLGSKLLEAHPESPHDLLVADDDDIMTVVVSPQGVKDPVDALAQVRDGLSVLRPPVEGVASLLLTRSREPALELLLRQQGGFAASVPLPQVELDAPLGIRQIELGSSLAGPRVVGAQVQVEPRPSVVPEPAARGVRLAHG